MKPRNLRLLLSSFVAAVLLFSTSAQAATRVFLNGVDIDGVTGQTFDNCTVTIDDKGNVHIAAPGYEVQSPAPVDPRPASTGRDLIPAEPVTKKFLLVSEQSVAGMVQYDIDILINSTWIKKLTSEESQVIIDISKYLHKGRNTIHFSATKNMKGPRKSSTPAHYMKVHVGEGSMGGNNIMIDNSLLEYTRTAAELDTFDEDFVVLGR